MLDNSWGTFLGLQGRYTPSRPLLPQVKSWVKWPAYISFETMFPSNLIVDLNRFNANFLSVCHLSRNSFCVCLKQEMPYFACSAIIMTGILIKEREIEILHDSMLDNRPDKHRHFISVCNWWLGMNEWLIFSMKREEQERTNAVWWVLIRIFILVILGSVFGTQKEKGICFSARLKTKCISPWYQSESCLS